MYDRGIRPSFESGLCVIPGLDQGNNGIALDVHSVASLLKSYLRELPEPLIPYSVYEDVMRVVTREREEEGEEVAVGHLCDIMTQTQSVPIHSYNTMQYVSRFLAVVAQHSDINKMTSANLATVFVQGFLQPEFVDADLMLATAMPRTIAMQVKSMFFIIRL